MKIINNLIYNQKKGNNRENRININEMINYILQRINKEEFTGFKPYKPMKIELKENANQIEGTYYQYNKGCILYAIINNGYIDEKLIPESMKFFKDHSHREDAKNDRDFLRRCISAIDLAQLWMNIGEECSYLEIDLIETKKRIYFVLKNYFDYPIIEETENMGKETKEKLEKQK
jgi:hypothetical protein